MVRILRTAAGLILLSGAVGVGALNLLFTYENAIDLMELRAQRRKNKQNKARLNDQMVNTRTKTTLPNGSETSKKYKELEHSIEAQQKKIDAQNAMIQELQEQAKEFQF